MTADFPTLYLIRHAPTGETGRYTGQRDVDCLAPTGLDEAQAAALANAHAAWFASDLQRSRRSAEFVRDCVLPATHIEWHPALREQSFGEWEGKSYDEVYLKNRGLDWNRPALLTPPGGESFLDMYARVESFLSAHVQNNAIIVAHAGSIRAILSHALGFPPEQSLRMQVDPGSISAVKYYELRAGGGSLEYLNRPLIHTTEGAG
ncbi:MAG: histidine phosphatase family protein [Alphaproteobacteria bacterium]|nr:histidine phosphatase family protein [Alphaproteobacteria bacterium]